MYIYINIDIFPDMFGCVHVLQWWSTVVLTKHIGGAHYSIIGTPVMKPIFAILQSVVQPFTNIFPKSFPISVPKLYQNYIRIISE